ncbi:MAG TPA: hypothetical protein DIS90_15000 [Cytophagales bacterium]|nr:hypothetical protein [Cytophagales bacterium]
MAPLLDELAANLTARKLQFFNYFTLLTATSTKKNHLCNTYAFQIIFILVLFEFKKKAEENLCL